MWMMHYDVVVTRKAQESVSTLAMAPGVIDATRERNTIKIYALGSEHIPAIQSTIQGLPGLKRYTRRTWAI